MAIVLPDAILGAPGLAYVRHWMLKHCRLIASIDLHPDTFQPRNGTQTSILILQRKPEAELRREAMQGQLNDYEIFMAQIMAMGHGKRGDTTYVRNDEGEELWVPGDDEPPSHLFEHTSSGVVTKRPLPKHRVVDDDSPAVADEFLAWKRKEVLGW